MATMTSGATLPTLTEQQQTTVIAGIEVDLDERGIPVMPADLVEYDRVDLDARPELGTIEARNAYKVWATKYSWTDISHLEFPTGSPGPCYEDPKGIFSISFPRWEDREAAVDALGLDPEPHREALARAAYQHSFDTAAMLIKAALAKKLCGECPLRLDCLAMSLTHPQRRDPVQIIPEVGDEVWGGWGYHARKAIFRMFHEMWLKDNREGSFRRWARKETV